MWRRRERRNYECGVDELGTERMEKTGWFSVMIEKNRLIDNIIPRVLKTKY